jgi:hypothetical protein
MSWDSSKPRQPSAPIEVRKVPATSVPYGEQICTRGKHVYAAYAPDGTLVCVAATAPKARSKYREIVRPKLST